MGRHVPVPVGLRLPEPARRGQDAATHEVDAIAHAAGAQLRIEQPIGLLVLGKAQQTRVRLVVQRHPERAGDALVLEQVGEDVGEARHVLHPERERAPLPRDLDRRLRAVRELHRPDERGHPVGERPLAVVEEHPDVPRPERQHLGLQTREIRRRPADVREYVLVELPAEAAEASDQAAARDHRELRRAGRLRLAGRHPGDRRGQAGRGEHDHSEKPTHRPSISPPANDPHREHHPSADGFARNQGYDRGGARHERNCPALPASLEAQRGTSARVDVISVRRRRRGRVRGDRRGC